MKVSQLDISSHPKGPLPQTILWEGCHLTRQLPQTAPWERFPEEKLGKQSITTGKAPLVGYITSISGNDRFLPHPRLISTVM